MVEKNLSCDRGQFKQPTRHLQESVSDINFDKSDDEFALQWHGFPSI